MKTFSSFAARAALAAGLSAVALAAPAVAKEKKADGAPSIKLSPDVQKAGAAAQAALEAKDMATAQPALAQMEAAAKTDDDRFMVASLKLRAAAMQLGQGNDAVVQQAMKGPLDVLISSPKTPQANLGALNFQRGAIAFNDNKPAEALPYLMRAQQLGYDNPNLPLQIAKVKYDTGDIAGGGAELEKAIAAKTAAGGKADEQLYRYGLSQANKSKDMGATLAWARRYMEAYPTAQNLNTVVKVYGLSSAGVNKLDDAQKIDLFRLLRASNALADQADYEIYATTLVKAGLPYEAKAVVNEGKAKGKIPASNSTAGDLLTVANQSIQNDGSIDAQYTKAKSASGKVAANTADALYGAGDYAKAIELYRLALQKGGVDADAVNTHLGIALAQSGDKAGAEAAFQAVSTKPRADIAAMWMSYLSNPVTA